MGNKINILFLVDGFIMGGVQKVNVSMLNNIDKNRFNVHVLYINKGILMDDLDIKNIKISKLGSFYKLKSYKNIFYIYKITKYISLNKIDIVHTIDPILYVFGAISAKLTNVRHVRTQPNFIRRHEKLNTKTLKILPFEKWTDRYITYNIASAKDLELAGVIESKIQNVYGFNGNDEYLEYKTVSDIREEFKIPKTNKIILAMHRMVPRKGFETFVNMIPYILEKYSNVTFLFVGDGPLRNTLKERVESLGVSDSVRFVGFQHNIANIIKQIDFGVYPLADTAAMGTVIRAGKVLITKKNSSMDEYILDGETGYLVPEEEPQVYAVYALKLLNDPQLLASMENKQVIFVKDKFDGRKNIKKLEDLFVHLCSDSQKS